MLPDNRNYFSKTAVAQFSEEACLHWEDAADHGTQTLTGKFCKLGAEMVLQLSLAVSLAHVH